MKKSLHSILTAAMFAAAVTTSVGSPTVSAQPGASSEAGLMLETEREQQGAYGPPNWYTTEPEKTELTMPITQPAYGPPFWSETESELTKLTESEPQDVYGPPSWFTENETTTTTDVTKDVPEPVYGPPTAVGDLTLDYRIDAKDLTWLKRFILENGGTEIDLRKVQDRSNMSLGDMNGDNKLNKEDVKLLVRQLTGKPEDDDDPKETALTTSATLVTTLMTTTTRPPTSLYGPQFTRKTTDRTTETLTTTDVTEPIPQPEYGAPEYFGEN